MNPLEVLKKYFGYNSFRQNQLEIIEAIMQGENILAVLPTGAGKSLCYQVPALAAKNFSIVISPLIALMKDQVDALNKNEEIAAFINSSQSFSESEAILQKLLYGRIKILYAAPERLSNFDFSERIKKLQPSYLFVDEAHCISEWGHNFRPSYRKISEFAEYISVKNISAFTATATPEVVQDIVSQLSLKNPKLFIRGFERENLELNVIITRRKKEKCLELLSQFKTPAIIYTSSRKMAEEVSGFLNLNRIPCAFYHAGMSSFERKRIHEEFINDRKKVIAATNAFGMGIDKRDIRLIIHYNTPGSIENYYQEIGRAGRDGKTSFIFLLHDDEDINIQNFFLANSFPDKQDIENIYDAICDYNKIPVGYYDGKEIPLNLEYISAVAKKKISNGILHSSLRLLEDGGYIKLVSEFDRKPQIQFTIDKNKLKNFIKNTSNITLRELIIHLLRNYGGEIFVNKIKISSSELSSQLNISETEIEEALIVLENLGFIIYKKTFANENAVLITPRVTAKNLRLDYKKLNESYLHLQKKIETMVDYVFTKDCRFKFILNYFGEDTSSYSCGNCDHCKNSNYSAELNSSYLREIILKTLFMLNEPKTEKKIISMLRGENNVDSDNSFSASGSCSNYAQEELKQSIHELLAKNFIEKSEGSRKFLRLTSFGRDFLIQNGIVDEEKNKPQNYETNLELFNLLREVRTKAAKKFLQTSYLICPDEVLREVARQRPSSRHELLRINGFNERMFNKIGHDFLEVLAAFSNMNKNDSQTEQSKKQLPANIAETLTLLEKKYSLKDISIMRQLSESVISMQIETILEYDSTIDISHLFSGNQSVLILNEIRSGFIDLKDLKNRLPKEISYPLIRIAVAKARL